MELKLEDYSHDASGCVRCSNCKFIEYIWAKTARFSRQCPINVRYKYNLYSGQGLMHAATGILNKELEFTPKLVDALYKCNSCGACDIRCKRNLDLEIMAVIETLKSKAVDMGAGPLLEHKTIAGRVKESNNRYGSLHRNRTKWLTKDINVTPEAEMLYFVGCRSSYIQTEISQATATILNKSKTNFMISADEWCCGYPLFSTGQVDAFKKQMEHNLEIVKNSGATTVLVSCAECYKTWKVDYPKLLGISTTDMEFKVVHIAEYVDELIKNGKLQLERMEKVVTYHDPCNLGRLGEPWYHWQGEHKHFGVLEPPKTWRRGDKGIYEPPRDILKSIPGLELIEMERIRDNSWCCGAGAGVRDAFKEYSLGVASERLEEAESTGAKAIVTTCPACKEILNDAAKEYNHKLNTYDITEIILQAMSKE